MNRIKQAVISILTTLSIYASTMPVSAGSLADNLTPILEDVATLFSGPMIDFVIAFVGIIIVLAVVGFVVGLFDRILDMIKI